MHTVLHGIEQLHLKRRDIYDDALVMISEPIVESVGNAVWLIHRCVDRWLVGVQIKWGELWVERKGI